MSVSEMRNRLAAVLGSQCTTDPGLRGLLERLDALDSGLGRQLREEMQRAGQV